MDFASAANELDRLAMIRSYLKTRNLEELAAREPELAAQVEALCRAVLALRGPAITIEAHASLRYSAHALQPFVQLTDEPIESKWTPHKNTGRTDQANKHGHVGVRFNAKRNRYQAQITIDGKKVHLGSFLTAEDAGKAYEKALKTMR